ncbi:MAG: riboflavin synthase [Ignavibacteria bacterium]|nr:riboflavin synthase [Ignavibacteria bacterium]
MFTGLIEDVGEVVEMETAADSATFTIRTILTDIKVDDSISVNGVCLTATAVTSGTFQTTAIKETLIKTTAGKLVVGSAVNLERAMRIGDRLGGHMVLGHTDCTGTITSIVSNSQGKEFWISFSPEFRKWLIPVGSICVNGVSLTIAELTDTTFKVAIIPHTLQLTNLGLVGANDMVNLEFDSMAKHVESIMNYKL